MSRGVARVYTRTPDERETTPASLPLVSPELFPVLGVTPVLGGRFPRRETVSPRRTPVQSSATPTGSGASVAPRTSSAARS